jgi:phage FluMu protein Com
MNGIKCRNCNKVINSNKVRRQIDNYDLYKYTIDNLYCDKETMKIRCPNCGSITEIEVSVVIST